jgi:hypothetical protein
MIVCSFLSLSSMHPNSFVVGFWGQDLDNAHSDTYRSVLPQAATDSGLWISKDRILPAGLAQAVHAPALITYQGELWCVWVAKDNTVWYATGTNTA